jgi:hypothetical protein
MEDKNEKKNDITLLEFDEKSVKIVQKSMHQSVLQLNACPYCYLFVDVNYMNNNYVRVNVGHFFQMIFELMINDLKVVMSGEKKPKVHLLFEGKYVCEYPPKEIADKTSKKLTMLRNDLRDTQTI